MRESFSGSMSMVDIIVNAIGAVVALSTNEGGTTLAAEGIYSR